MAFAKSVAVLAILAALGVVYFAQEASADVNSTIYKECESLNDCLKNPDAVKDCEGQGGNLCCHGDLAGEAAPGTDLHVVAVVQGICTCCSGNSVCKIANGTAVNPLTGATAQIEKCG